MGIILTVFAVILGSLPFSVWIGQRSSGEDIRNYGDHNPGATNVLRAGGFFPFLLALFLDITKGALPVGLAYYILGIQDGWMLAIALAPPLGHAFSPFLNWRGGKAIAATFGVWIGLTIWVVPLAGVILLTFWSLLLKPSGWAVLLSTAGLFIFILLWNPLPLFISVLIGQTGLLIWKHRDDLAQRPHFRQLSANGVPE